MNPISRGKWTPLTLLAAGAVFACLCGSVVSAASYQETVLADGPAAYWRLEELAGVTVIVDSSSLGSMPGEIITSPDGGYPILGQPGIETNSMNFSQGAYITVPYTTLFNRPGPFAVELWARPTSVSPTDYRSPIGNFGGWGDASGWFFYQAPATPTAQWIWVQKGGGIWLGAGAAVPYKWDYLAASFDGTTVSVYLNGELVNSGPAADALPNSSLPFFIGSRESGSLVFDGNVDEVAVYTNALTQAQITQHYTVGLANFRTGTFPPTISREPLAVTRYAGHTVAFTVGADGTAPLTYQWYRGSVPIEGATTDTLTFTCAFEDNGMTYKVKVTNPYGTDESTPVALTVLTDLTLPVSPASITRTVGSAAAFRVAVEGAKPYSFQWYKGTSAISDATNATLWIPSVQQADDASTYYVRVTNPFTASDSEAATLTVIPRLVEVPLTGYARLVAASKPVAVWRLNETDALSVATDAVGSFDGVFDDNAGAGTFSFAQSGMPLDTDKAVSVTGGARVSVPYALELNPHGPFTAEAWVMPATLAADGNDYRSVFASMGSGVGGPVGWNLYQTPGHQWAWFLWGDNWINSGLWGPAGGVVANTWYHIVLSYDGTTFRMFSNGELLATSGWTGYVPNGSGATFLGWRTDRDWKPFTGALDEVAFYNRALSVEEVQTHYTGSVRLTVDRAGDTCILSWPMGTLQQSSTVNGTYADVVGASSPYTASPSSSMKFFRVKQ